MIYFLISLIRNAIVLMLRLVCWPLLVLARIRPAMLRIDLPASPPARAPGRLARWMGRDEMDLDSILWWLDRAARDPGIRGVVVLAPELAMGATAVTEIREALAEVVGAGKTVVVVLTEGGGMTELRLAPPGARVVLHASASLMLTGPAAAPLFLGELLGRYGVKADLIAVGDYKSAPEMFTRSEMSENNREQLQQLLEDRAEHLIGQVAKGRGVEPETVQGWMKDAVFTSQEAVSAGVVDEARYDHEVLDAMRGKGRVASPSDRLLGLRRRLRLTPLVRPRVVGVISVRGQILSRSGPGPGAGQALSDRLVPLIRRAGRSSALAALVVEIDSRGGSPVASDRIYRQVARAAKKKPVVIYLRDVAASGAYYIAAAGPDVVASPECITGSIGVFGGKIASDGALQRIGVNMQRMTTGDPGAGIMIPDRPFDDQERSILQKHMRSIYETFLEVVAARKDGRVEDVEPLAGGRIWSASRALEVGLVDRTGTWRDVVAVVAERVGCTKERLRLVRMGRPDPFRALSSAVSTGIEGGPLGQTVALVVREGVALEMPFFLSEKR